jgi:hypothetical protein
MTFEGNLLVVNTAHGGGAVIEGPEFRAIGPKQFLVGTSIVSDDHGLVWTAGSRIWIAVDAIATITEVSDAAEYRNRLAIHRDNKPHRAGDQKPNKA